MNNFNDLLLDIEAGLLKDKLNKGLLINQGFLLWYILVEGFHCEDFSESDIKDRLKKNIETYQDVYVIDGDYSFIVGWMLTVAFWYFDPLFKEDDGAKLLDRAYRTNTKNSLFKWALRKVFRLKNNEIKDLELDIESRFEQFYNYGSFIKEYFLDVI